VEAEGFRPESGFLGYDSAPSYIDVITHSPKAQSSL